MSCQIAEKKSLIFFPVCGASRYEDAGSDQNLFQIVNGWEARIHEFPWQVTTSLVKCKETSKIPYGV